MRADQLDSDRERTLLHLWETGGLPVVDLEGVEDLFDEEELNSIGQQLYRLVDEGGVVLVNLRGVQHLSSGVSARLAWLHRRIQGAQGRLLICGVNPYLREVFRQCRLDRVLELFTEEAGTLAARWVQESAIN